MLTSLMQSMGLLALHMLLMATQQTAAGQNISLLTLMTATMLTPCAQRQ